MRLDDKFLFIIILLFFLTPNWELKGDCENVAELQMTYSILVLMIVLKSI